MDIGNLVVTVLTALSSLISIYRSGKEISEKNMAVAETRIRNPLKRGGQGLHNIIDEELLSAMGDDLQHAFGVLVSIIRNQNLNASQKRKAINDADEAICQKLREILNRNGGYLPTTRLRDMWLSHQCRA